MSLNDLSMLIAHGTGILRWAWAKLVGSVAAFQGVEVAHGEMGRRSSRNL